MQLFAQVFDKPVWAKAQVLLIGAFLTLGRCTVACVLRVTGLGGDPGFIRRHYVLDWVVWSARGHSYL